MTVEIFEILGKQLTINKDQLYLNTSIDKAERNIEEENNEEIDIEDLKDNLTNEYNNKLFKQTNICFLIHVCLENISNKVYIYFKLAI